MVMYLKNECSLQNFNDLSGNNKDPKEKTHKIKIGNDQ